MAAIYETPEKIDYSIGLILVFIYGFFIATTKEISIFLFVPILVQAIILKLNIKTVFKKVLKVNLFIAITFLILFIEENYELAWLVFVRANLILWFTLSFGFCGFTLYRGLNNLKISNKFSLILFFTVKYVEVLLEEAIRLKNTIFIRGFKAKFDLNTLKVYANLISFLIFKTLSRLSTVEDLLVLRSKDGVLMPARKIQIRSNEIILLATILGVIFVYYFR